jgi:multidrug efflux pump
MLTGAIYDVADTVIAQRISQVPGVGEATVSGADQPAVRIQLNPGALATAGISSDDVRTAIVNANAIGPVGAFDGAPSGKHWPPIRRCVPPRSSATS